MAADLVGRARPPAGALVLDLGAGDGVITRRLLARHARVVALELHRGRAAALRRDLAGEPVKVVTADVRDLRLPTQPFRVVANPPFDGISAVLARLTHTSSRLERADLLVPRSVARAWGERATRRRWAWSFTIERAVPRSAFTPRPRVDVVHLAIVRRR